MNYLTPDEYESHGLDAATAQAWVTAASALMDAHCRRPTLGVAEYTESMRVAAGVRTVRVSHLPLAALAPSPTPLLKLRARYGMPRTGDPGVMEMAQAFGLPGMWSDLDASRTEWSAGTGEITVPTNVLGLTFNEIEITYTAGLAEVPEAVKSACAQIVRNAQATPALNVRGGGIDQMQLQYFSDTLLDATVRALLQPYVAVRL